MKVFVSPHDDDHALFGAFTCLREHPLLVVVFDGHAQQERGLDVTARRRALETAWAADILECQDGVIRLGFSDAQRPLPSIGEISERMSTTFQKEEVTEWWLPAWELYGNQHHNLVASMEPVQKTTRYATYTEHGKTITPWPVDIKRGSWIASKLQALSVYQSQMDLDPRMGCAEHFLRQQQEYYCL